MKFWSKVLIFIFISGFCIAELTINLDVDRHVFYIGETVHFTLDMQSQDKLTGQVDVYKVDQHPKTQVKSFLGSYPPGCVCRPDTRIGGTINQELSYIPQTVGVYEIVASYREDGGLRLVESVNVSVEKRIPDTTTTTSLAPVVEITTTTSSTTTTSTTTTTTTTTTTLPDCSGCWYLDECIRLESRSGKMYCSSGGMVFMQKNMGDSCGFDYECANEFCVRRECRQQNIFNKVLKWLEGLF